MKPYPYYQHKDINNLEELLKRSLENKVQCQVVLVNSKTNDK